MSRPAAAPRLGVQKPLPLKLPPEIEIDLHVFCKVHYGAPHTKVIAAAVAHFIREKRSADPVLEAEFTAEKARFMQTYLEEKKGPRLLKVSERVNQPNSVRRRREPQE